MVAKLVEAGEQGARQPLADPLIGLAGADSLGGAARLGVLGLDGAAEPVVGEHARQIEDLAGNHQRQDDPWKPADERRRDATTEEEQVPLRREGGLQVGAESLEH